MEQKTTIDIILPHRIGDCILTLPALFCLDELIKKFDKKKTKIRLISGTAMLPFLKTLNLFKLELLSYPLKILSWFFPVDKAFFYLTSSKTLGYKAKLTYGQHKDAKKYLHYDINVPYIVEYFSNKFPNQQLLNFLKDEYKLSAVTINNFAICLELNYTFEQIKEVFPIAYEKLSSKTVAKSDYFVCCMEAGYGKKTTAERRGNPEDFIDVANYIHEKYGFKTIFIGMDKSTKIPNKPYLLDCRKKSNITNLIKIIDNSIGYFGNDTGPLHLANLLGKPSLGLYTTISPESYGPIFAHKNYPIFLMDDKKEVYSELDKMIQENTPINQH